MIYEASQRTPLVELNLLGCALIVFFAGQPQGNNDYNPRIYLPSKWVPHSSNYPAAELRHRLKHFKTDYF